MIMASPVPSVAVKVPSGRSELSPRNSELLYVVLRDRRLQALLADLGLELDHGRGEVEDGVPLGAESKGGAEALELHDAVVRELLDAQHLGMNLGDLSRHFEDRLVQLGGG